MAQIYYGMVIILGALGVCWLVGTVVLFVLNWILGL